MATAMLKPLVQAWMGKLQKAAAHKKVEFQDDADEAMQFFDGPHDFMYSHKYMKSDDEGAPSPTFRMTVNKVAEVVQLYGPSLYHRNPYRHVTPRRPPEFPSYLLGDPGTPEAQQSMQMLQMQEANEGGRMQAIADLVQHVLNYTPNELDLRGHSRQMVDESVIKGMGTLWTEVYQPPGGRGKFIGSFYDSVDNLLIDPDVEAIEHAKWVARRRVLPVWEVEDRYGLKRGTLRGNLKSDNAQGEVQSSDEYRYFQARGDTNDLYVYMEVYSRMGMGHLLKDCYGLDANRELLDQFGKHIYMAVSNDHPWPLNLPEEVFEGSDIEEVFMRLQWPIPFWADPTNPWPFSYTAFHKRPRKIWPMSHIKPGLGELRFINWAISFLADKIKNTSRDFVAVLKSASEDIRTNILSGKDLTLLEFEKVQGRIQDVVQMLQFQPVNPDIWRIIDAMFVLLDKRLGTNELMYGQTAKQIRSAQEAAVKSDSVNIRPDDMAECVEACMTMVARKEAIASRWMLTGEDVAPILGPQRAQLWDQLVRSSDITEIVTELEYRIEAGSVRKPNKNRDMENANASVQVWSPFFQNYALQTGDFKGINGILEMWSKAFDLDPSKFILSPPPPNDQAAQMQQEMQMQQAQLELQVKQEDHQQKMQQAQEKHQLTLQQLQEKQQVQGLTSQASTQQQLEQKEMQHQQGLQQREETHSQDLQQDQQNFLLEMLQARQMGQQQLENSKQMTAAQVAATKAKAQAAPAKPAASKK